MVSLSELLASDPSIKPGILTPNQEVVAREMINMFRYRAIDDSVPVSAPVTMRHYLEHRVKGGVTGQELRCEHAAARMLVVSGHLHETDNGDLHLTDNLLGLVELSTV